MNQQDIDFVAASKALAKKADAKDIKPGTYSGEVTFKVKYSLTKAEDGEQSATSNLLSQAVLAKAIVRSGIQADAFLATLLDVAQEALADEKSVSVAITEADQRVAARIAELQAKVVAKLPKTPKSGSTKVISEVTRVVDEQV